MENQTNQMPAGYDIRYTLPEDGKYLKEWLMDPQSRHGFPMADEVEVDDAVARWIIFYRFKCSLTMTKDGVPCGIATLYLQPYVRLSHQCEFGIIMGKHSRQKGMGSYLMSSLIALAKEKFKIELLHLTVFADSPAVGFYKKFGFKEFGRQNAWFKDGSKYSARLFMQRFI